MKLINFVPEGKKPPKKGRNETKQEDSLGLLSGARDWIVDFDLPSFRTGDSKYVFPYEICATPLRIDGYIVSHSTKVALLVLN